MMSRIKDLYRAKHSDEKKKKGETLCDQTLCLAGISDKSTDEVSEWLASCTKG